MQLSNDASNTYNVLPLMRDLPKAKVLATEVEISGQDTAAELAALKATAKAQDAKIKALSAQLRATHRVPSVHAAAPQWTRSLSQCALCVSDGGTMPQTVGTSWTPTKQS